MLRLVVGIGVVVVLLLSLFVLTITHRDIGRMRSDLESLRAETCVEMGLQIADGKLLQIELKALHGISVDRGLSDVPSRDESDPYHIEMMKVLGTIYTIPPRGGGADRLMNRCE